MKIRASAVTAAVLLMLAAQSAMAESAVGYVGVIIPATADVRLSVPFNPVAEETLTVTGGAPGTTLQVGAGNLAGDDYGRAGQKTFYVRFISGSAEGLWSTITAHDDNSLTIEDAGVGAEVANGDLLRVYKHATIESVLPDALEGVSFNGLCQVLVFDNDLGTIEQNRSATKVAARFQGAWVGSANDATVLEPETQFILRNKSSDQLTFYTWGCVPDYEVSMLIAPGGDINIGSGYPVPVVLKASGLGDDFRQVLFYDNLAPGENKSAVKTAAFVGGSWVGGGVTGDELITPAETVTLRLPGSETGTRVTVNKPY